MQRRFDLLSPEHAERPLPMPTMENFIPRNKPSLPPLPHQQQQAQDERQLAPLPELADLSPGFAPEPHYHPYLQHPARMHGANQYFSYETAPVPAGIEYPASPLQAVAPGKPGKTMTMGGVGMGEANVPLSPLSVPSGGGFWGLKSMLTRRRK